MCMCYHTFAYILFTLYTCGYMWFILFLHIFDKAHREFLIRVWLQELFLLVIQDKKIQRLMDELDLPPDRANLPLGCSG